MEELRDQFEYFPPFGAETIQRIIPHRYPFLLIDRITEFTEDSVSGFKMLTMSDPVFQGHFPGHPIYPGVMQVEAIAQVGACWILARKANLGKIAYLMTVEEAKFRAPALPGMRLDIHGKITNLKSRTGKLVAEITVDGKVISNATVLFAFQKEETGVVGR